MVVIGGDAHKRTHTLVAVDQVGRKLGERTVPATPRATCRPWHGLSAGPSRG